ncbi:MAG: carbohydrate-binding protein [Paludibacteraceae bacterium]|nr:carbohydrate-binding protein [Prevotellaceae bacterium]
MRHFSFVVLLLCMNLGCFAQFGGTQSGGGLDGYTSKTDIDYVGDNHIGHKLDIYYPNDNQSTHNVIIHIYGSAWGSNNSKGSADLGTVGKAALDAGYIFVTPNHRTYNDALYPAQINDIKAVVRYLRGNAESLKIDDSFIAISGFSSGGHLASLMGVTRDVKKEYTVGSATMDIEGELGNYTKFSSWVDAVCDWSGPVDCRDKGCGNPINMSPENDMVGGCSDQQCPDKHALLGANTFIDKDDAPVMVVHGSSDNIVPQCEGEKFYNNLKKAGVDCEYYPNGGGHGVNGEFTDEMITFFNRIRSSHPVAPKNGVTLSSSEKSIEPGIAVTLTANATVESSTVTKIDIYQDNAIIATLTEEPFSYVVENLDLGTYSFKAIMTASNDSTYNSEEISVTVKLSQSPYNGTAQAIPGKVEMENYDEGDDGYAYHDSDAKNEGDGNMRLENGVDIVEAGNGYAIGYTAVGEWVEFTIDVKYTDIYQWSANVASGSTSAGFKLYLDDTAISDAISIPQTANNSWDTYEIITGKTPSISEGKHILKVEITGANGNIDYIEFKTTTVSHTGLEQETTVYQIEKSYEVYSLLGTKIGDITIKQGDNIQESVKNLVGRAGTYALRNIYGSSQLLIIK